MDEYGGFVSGILALTGIDLADYKERQVRRRVDQLMESHGFSVYQTYLQALSRDETLLGKLVDGLVITVSEFFRNPDQWELLERQYLPELTGRFGRELRVWSAGCGRGEEAYSLVMSLAGHGLLGSAPVLATDISPAALTWARTGLYGEKELAHVPASLRRKYFVPAGQLYQVLPELRRCVDFQRQDLLGGQYPERCHLIACRNVLHYFSDQGRRKAMAALTGALMPGGVLFIGTAEMIPDCQALGLKKREGFFYEKI